MFPAYTIENYVEFGQDCQQKKETLSKQEFKLFQDRWGRTLVNHCIKISLWWESLAGEWEEKLKLLPFATIDRNGLHKLAQMPLEALNDWYQEITASLEEHGVLSPQEMGRIASLFLPKSKKNLKLGETLTDEDFALVGKKYKLTATQLEVLTQQTLELADGNPAVTEDMFPLLEAQELDPSVLLGKGDRTTWWLKQKDAEIELERSLRLETEQKLNEELDQRLAQQAQVYEEKLNEQAQQHQAIMQQQAQRIAKLEQLMNDELSQQKPKKEPNSFFSEVNSLTPDGFQPSKKAQELGNLAMANSGTSH
ncbi:hypothetical protein [Crocosphaera watsonii]|uniref:hypothetical protein n=1 Tax=Crocosphaera watsonii TaxID=263511 RepID=UPI000304550D|nr:hypothetical protein [Crocosphaera watsonii]